jgi:hypothetical protein
VHGCPPGEYTVTFQPSFVTYQNEAVSVAKEDIWEMNGDYVIFPPACKVTDLRLDYKKYNGFATAGGIVEAASCGGANPCNKIDLVWNGHPHSVEYRYKFTISSGEFFYTPDIKIDLVCKPESTTITPSFDEDMVYTYD